LEKKALFFINLHLQFIFNIENKTKNKTFIKQHIFNNIMQDTYSVQKDGESLTAKIIGEEGRIIELLYLNKEGESQVSKYMDGIEISKQGNSKNPFNLMKDSKGDICLMGYKSIYQRLGPELMEKIPEEWREKLGSWIR
jgi:hypothetical protein